MKRFRQVAVLLALAISIAILTTTTEAFETNQQAYWRAQVQPWNAGYYSAGWGMPIALVVPPKAATQTAWGWGVGNTRVTPINHQFHAMCPVSGSYHPYSFAPKPVWPRDTQQMGVYYIRGPW